MDRRHVRAANQGNFRGDIRLQEMDADGVDAEVLYGSARMLSHFLSDADPAFHLAGVRAYNSWLADAFAKVAPDRLVGLAAMPALGTDACIRELERCLALGWGAWLLTLPSAGPASRQDDPARAGPVARVPVHFHVRPSARSRTRRASAARHGAQGGPTDIGIIASMSLRGSRWRRARR
jgi:predicted TIM-barrel fold metal-dependent hydrolase